jgi:hypothetical protein
MGAFVAHLTAPCRHIRETMSSMNLNVKWIAAPIVGLSLALVPVSVLAAQSAAPPSGVSTSTTVTATTCGITQSDGGTITGTTPCAAGESAESCALTTTGSGSTPTSTETLGETCESYSSQLSTAAGGNPSPSFCSIAGGLPGIGLGITSACAIGGVLTFLGTLIGSLNSPAGIFGDLFGFLSKMLSIPFAANGGLTSWINEGNAAASLSAIYAVLMPLGLALAVVSCAARVTKNAVDRKSGANITTLTEPIIRLMIAGAVIVAFFNIATWLIPLSDKMASDLYTTIGSAGYSTVFTGSGSFNLFQAGNIASADAFILIVALVIIFIALLWLLFLFLMRSVTLLLGTMLAPFAIGLAVYDLKMAPVTQWQKWYVGALFSASLGAIGMGVSFSVASSLILAANGNMFEEILGLAMLIGGLIATGKMMTMGHGGVAGSMGMMAVGGGMMAAVGGIASMAGGAVSAVGGAAAGASSAGSALMTAKTAAPMAAGALAAKVTGGAVGGSVASGIVQHAPLSQQSALAPLEGGAQQVMAHDPTSREMVNHATSFMPATSSFEDRMGVVSNSKEFRPMTRQWLGGSHMGALSAGADPKSVKTNFTDAQKSNLMDSAKLASQKYTASHHMARVPNFGKDLQQAGSK